MPYKLKGQKQRPDIVTNMPGLENRRKAIEGEYKETGSTEEGRKR